MYIEGTRKKDNYSEKKDRYREGRMWTQEKITEKGRQTLPDAQPLPGRAGKPNKKPLTYRIFVAWEGMVALALSNLVRGLDCLIDGSSLELSGTKV